MSTIWIINQYASTPATGIAGRHRHFARELAARGHRVYLIAARWHHLLRDTEGVEAAPAVEEVEGFKFVRIRTPRYGHAHDKRRMFNWMLFAWRLTRLGHQIQDRPDVIMCSSPSLFALLGAERLARKFAARLVFEVRDIWPLTLLEVGGYSRRHPMIRLMQWVEDRAYRQADRVISNLPGAVDHMVARGMNREKFSWIPNGLSMTDVSSPEPVPEEILAQIPANKYVVGYAGTMGLANALDNLLSAATRLRDHRDIVFVLVGNGRIRSQLKAEANFRKLDNVIFIDSIPKEMIPSMLVRFDACFIGWHQTPLYRFGVAANKIFDYLYSGRPILHSFSGGYDPVKTYDAGFTVRADDPAALAEAILQLRALPIEERRRLGENGKQAALEHHDYGILAERLESVLLN